MTVAILVSWVAAMGLAWFTWDLLSSVPDRDTLRRVGDMAQATTLLDRKDRPVFTIFTEQRIEIPLARMSPLLVKAIISIEDQRFYDHQGVDTVRIAAAALANVREGRRAQGGSTLTQQLARQAFLTLDKSYVRKLKEVIVAAELESEYSKDEILELYLNKVYFGDGLHGVEAAAQGFFGKSAADLTLAEAALIAGLVKSPSSYAPTVNLKRAITRRDLVLQTMVGSGVVTAAEAEEARAQPVQLKSTLGRDDPHGAWFKEEVRRQLIARFGLDRVYQGGLKVYTTVDMAMQQAAELLVEDALIEVENRRAAGRKKGAPIDETPLEGALVALDPQTGHVRALVGGRSFESSQFNRAIQAKRQPGSAFKPFVFAAALEQGLVAGVDHRPARRADPDAARRVDARRRARHDADDDTAHGPAHVEQPGRRAPPRRSRDPADSGLREEAGRGPGPQRAVAGARHRRGDARGDDGGVRDVCQRRCPPHAGLHPPRRGWRRAGDLRSARRRHAGGVRGTAFLLSSMLSDVVNYGTAWKARRVGFVLPAAGKTGTTNDYVDAWFVGYTPKLVAGVWIGFDQPQTIIGGGYAGEIAVPLWGRFMKAATRGDRPEWFATPKGLVGVAVCRISGQLPDAGCSDVEVIGDTGEVSHRSMVITDYFRQGKAPSQVCPLHPGHNMLSTMAGWFGKDGAKPVLGLRTGAADAVGARRGGPTPG